VTISPTEPGFLLLFAQGKWWPGVSTINYSPGQIRASNAIVSLAAEGEITAWTNPPLGSHGTVDLILDVSGYFQ
jgi:hypothetical protein